MELADETRLIVVFGAALAAAFAATPLAIALAGRTDFHDQPLGYKAHARPTPYLGGAAVLAGFLVGVLTLGDELVRLSPILALACVLWALGTLDDRVGLSPWPRLLVEALAGAALWATGLGWEVFDLPVLDVLLTVLWVAALVNSFNLIDNIDGAAATVASVTGVVIGVLAALNGDFGLAVLGVGLAGACLGFLPYNLAAPSRIFLGDGGSLPIGFVIAALLMVIPQESGLGLSGVLAAVLLAGVPLVDTALVAISRRRAGIPFLTGGRDHLTHRLRSRLETARSVAIVLGVVQACVGAVAIGVVELGRGSVVAAWTVWFFAASAAIALFETRSWAPARDVPAPAPRAERRLAGRSPRVPSLVEAALIAFVTISCGLSPFLYGFYGLSVWGPIAIGLVAAVIALLVARPAVPRRSAQLAAAALAGLWLLALLSTGWAESADQATLDASRWGLYAVLFGIMVLLLREDRLSRLLIASATAGVLVLAGYLVIEMLAGSWGSLFVAGRLNEPLGYVNGQSGYFAMGIWPLVAAAERASKTWAAGIALAIATILGGLAVLGQTRAVLPAFALAALVMIVLVPGRGRRMWMLLAIVAGVAVSLPALLDVYDEGRTAGSAMEAAVLREAAAALLLAGALVGVAWVAVTALGDRVSDRLGNRRALRAGLTFGPICLVAIIGATALFQQADPVGALRDEYRAFVRLDTDRGSATRFTAGGSNRYDYWRVAGNQFADKPVFGIGAGNYDTTYFRERRTTEDIRQPHSLELQVLAELGIAGALLLALFLGSILWALVRRGIAAGESRENRALVVGAGGLFLTWLVHTSVDWLHLIPGLTGVALCAAAALAGPWRGKATAWSWLRVGMVSAAVVAAIAVAVITGRAALAEHYREQAQGALPEAPAKALESVNRSLALNDEALGTYYVRASAWARLGDYPRARRALREATRREPHDFVTWALLGDLATRAGRTGHASASYARALDLNPRDPGLRELVSRSKAGP